MARSLKIFSQRPTTTTTPYKHITYMINNIIKNGDIWDINQTVNGNSRFLYLNDKWHYATGYNKELFISSIYQYDKNELTKSITEDYDNETKLIGNIFTDDMKLDFSQCQEVIQAIREYKLNNIINN